MFFDIIFGDFTVAYPDPTTGSPAGVAAIISLNAN
jgi:hypothetical protein